ncbi:MAG TPA: hypothetical protein VFG77_07570 [Nitrososphaeraceae archaeon]|nr:hypothetical protein [Nitrososphaeraceae archaeon]
MTIGEDGKPRVREFGNIKPSTKGLVEQSGLRAPLVDAAVNEKENVLAVLSKEAAMRSLRRVLPEINMEQSKIPPSYNF